MMHKVSLNAPLNFILNRAKTMKESEFTYRQLCMPLLLTLVFSTACVRVYVPIGAPSSTSSDAKSERDEATLTSQRLKSESAVIVDARTPGEFDEKHYHGAVNIPHDVTSIDVTVLGSNLERPVLIYCRSGKRAELLRTRILALGYTNTINGGGLEELLELK